MIERARQELRRLAGETESGQAMVEFVLVFPMQLLLTLAIIQFAFLLHAHLVVYQAAFLGARAAAVSDLMEPRISAEEAAKRVVARTVAVLTASGDGPLGDGISPPHALDWPARGGRWGFEPERQRQAYALLRRVTVTPTDVSSNPDGYVSCDVEFDYLLSVPVANSMIRLFSPAPGPGQYKTFRVRRVGFVATPWTVPPQ